MSGTVVLHVAKASGISGSEAHLLLLLPQLRERGWDVRFLLLHEDEPGAWELAARLDGAGVPVQRVRLSRAADPLAFGRVLRVVRRQRPAILHTHLVHADFHGLLAGRLARVPVLASTKHGFNPFRASRAFAAADRVVGRLVDLHIAISGGLARYLADTEGFAEQSFEVVHYGIVPGPEPSPPPDAPRVAVVGRLIPIKGHHVLLEAAAAAVRELPGLEVEIAGAGPLDTELRERATALGLDGKVRFLGHTPAAEVIERAAVVAVPSLGEGFGMVALEAMERGRAVVASDVGGLPEIVADGTTGVLVPAGDAAALAAALVDLAGNAERVRAFGEGGRARALDAFPQDRCTGRTEELYEAALRRKGLSPRS
ncbi:MAG: glycosyltransferase family 4 protein [Thermoleophilia bacterium]|nr:glycosyltransferase family 4 protein [Thermoleophilia bacterium]MDH5333690.1 glycosyltransferase family 4 protein [Thermoleophilia bacterium]